MTDPILIHLSKRLEGLMDGSIQANHHDEQKRFTSKISDEVLKALDFGTHPFKDRVNDIYHRLRKMYDEADRPGAVKKDRIWPLFFALNTQSGGSLAVEDWPVCLLLLTTAYSTNRSRIFDYLTALGAKMSRRSFDEIVKEASKRPEHSWSEIDWFYHWQKALPLLDTPAADDYSLEGQCLCFGRKTVKLSAQQYKFLRLLAERFREPVSRSEMKMAGVTKPSSVKSELQMKLEARGISLDIVGVPTGRYVLYTRVVVVRPGTTLKSDS